MNSIFKNSRFVFQKRDNNGGQQSAEIQKQQRDSRIEEESKLTLKAQIANAPIDRIAYPILRNTKIEFHKTQINLVQAVNKIESGEISTNNEIIEILIEMRKAFEKANYQYGNEWNEIFKNITPLYGIDQNKSEAEAAEELKSKGFTVLSNLSRGIIKSVKSKIKT